MNRTTTQRLEQILPRITEAGFLSSEGIGNEIACYIFDYPSEDELVVREHIQWMTLKLESNHSGIRFLHLNIFDVVLEYLKKRNLLDKSIKMEQAKGDAAVLKALRGPLAAEKIRDYIAETYIPSDYDLVLFSGVGTVWPAVRAHSLLNSLHAILGNTPLVMFYPGSFDGTTLSLFDQIRTHTRTASKQNYYRAFSLIPRKTQT
jgi:hypothetical protein